LRHSEIVGDRIELAGDRTKNGEPHTIPLSDAARTLISSLPHIGNGEYVFTTTGETPISGWSRAKLLVDQVITAQNDGAPIPAWRLHDIRRTVATGMQRLGIGLPVVEAVLGHVSGSRSGIVGVYQRHNYSVEKRDALQVWAGQLTLIVNHTAINNVIAFQRP
jgi:integrase